MWLSFLYILFCGKFISFIRITFNFTVWTIKFYHINESCFMLIFNKKRKEQTQKWSKYFYPLFHLNNQLKLTTQPNASDHAFLALLLLSQFLLPIDIFYCEKFILKHWLNSMFLINHLFNKVLAQGSTDWFDEWTKIKNFLELFFYWKIFCCRFSFNFSKLTE